MAQAWQPNPEIASEVVKLFLHLGATTGEQHMSYVNALQTFESRPEALLYLAYIFAYLQDNRDEKLLRVRNLAGIELKNALVKRCEVIARLIGQQQGTVAVERLQEQHFPTFEYARVCSLHALHDSTPNLRSVAGMVLGSLSRVEPFCPVIVRDLMVLMRRHSDDPQNPNYASHTTPGSENQLVEAASSAMKKVCEESYDLLQLSQRMLLEELFNVLFIRVGDPSAVVRNSCIRAINVFITSRADVLRGRIEQFLNIISLRGNDDNADVRQSVCESLTSILSEVPESLYENLDSIINFILDKSEDKDEEVALEAGEFWLVYAESKNMVLRDRLQPALSRLLPMLLNKMVYTADDVERLMEDDGAERPDRDQDVRPRFYKSKGQAHGGTSSGAGEDEDLDGDDEGFNDDEEEWNLRKCSAACIDLLAGFLPDALIVELLPLIDQKLQNPQWEVRESGILALGAIADNVRNSDEDRGAYAHRMLQMDGYLHRTVPFLIHTLEDPSSPALLRSITCWTVGRYGWWVARHVPESQEEAHRKQILEPVLVQFLKMIPYPSKKVQEAACSGFAYIQREAGVQLSLYLNHIVPLLGQALEAYQRRNLLNLYDVIATLADSVGRNLANDMCINSLLLPLLARWQAMQPDDRDMLPLLECLAALISATGPAFERFAPDVWKQCLDLITFTFQREQNRQHLLAQAANGDAAARAEVEAQGIADVEDVEDRDFVILALDLLSAITQALNQSVAHLVDKRFMELFIYSMKDHAMEIRQSAYALLGDLVIACFDRISEHMGHIIPIAINELIQLYERLVPHRTNGAGGPPSVHGFASRQLLSVLNNATWALGEISLRFGHGMDHWVPHLLPALNAFLRSGQDVTPQLQENLCIAIGRLGMASPELVSEQLPTFLRSWCEVARMLPTNEEKASSFYGICLVVSHNPQGAVGDDLLYLLDAILTYEHPSTEMHQKFQELLGNFQTLYAQVGKPFPPADAPQHIRVHLASLYGIGA
ncbi:armadillo-type protein [Cladochytrium replicatum]|nr:armadillo-type protein [Cladochytrium replicatum]